MLLYGNILTVKKVLNMLSVFVCVIVSLALGGGATSSARAETVTTVTTKTETSKDRSFIAGIWGVRKVSDASAYFGWSFGTNVYGTAQTTSKELALLVVGEWQILGADSMEYTIPLGDSSLAKYTFSKVPGKTFTGSNLRIKASWSSLELCLRFDGPGGKSKVKGFKVEVQASDGSWNELVSVEEFSVLRTLRELNIGDVTRTFKITKVDRYDPVVTANPDLERQLGQSVDDSWTEGVTAHWGKSTDKKISWKNTDNGEVTNTSLEDGNTDSELSSDGKTFDSLGIKTHTLEVRDSHSLRTDAEYKDDNTSTETTRTITVKTSVAPSLDMTVNGSSKAYDNKTWMAPKGKNADPARSHGVDVTAHTSDPGTYTLHLKQNSVSVQSTSVTNNPVTGASKQTATLTNYSEETPKAGTPFSALLTGTGDDGTVSLSPETSAERVYIDNTAPSISAKDGSTDHDYSVIKADVKDSLSGANGAYYTIVKDGEPVPTTPSDGTDWTPVADYERPVDNGTYSVYVYGKDKATNRTDPIQAASFTNKSVTGTVTWDDKDNQDGKRPDSVTVRLKRNGAEVASKTVTADDDWKFSFDGQVDTDSTAQAFEYTVEQDTLDGYTTAVDGDMTSGFTLTNTHTPAQTAAKVSVKWDDTNDADKLRPGSVTVRLLADGVDTGKTLTLRAADGWTGSFAGLDVYRDHGTAIVYTVEQNAIDRYTTAVTGSIDSGFTITNTHASKLSNTGASITLPAHLSATSLLLAAALTAALLKRRPRHSA